METNFGEELEKIKQRNQKVEADKGWEISFTRRIYIALITYATATVWLLMIHEPLPWLKALVPAVSYIFSTLSLPPLKRWWSKNR